MSLRRREFIAGLGGAATWPFGANAQGPRLPMIGFLSSGSPRAFAALVAACHKGMSELGYTEGRNVFITYHWAEGHYDELDALANDLVRRQVKLIVAPGGLVSAKAAMKATTTIPILFVVGFDPVQLGLVPSLARPGGNATGASIFSTELLPKRLELLYKLGHRIQTVGFLQNPEAPQRTLTLKTQWPRPSAMAINFVFSRRTPSVRSMRFSNWPPSRWAHSWLLPTRSSLLDETRSSRSRHAMQCL